MQAILKFKLPEERPEHLNALHGGEYFALIDDIKSHCRKFIKYHDEQITDDQRKIYEEIQTLIYEGLNDIHGWE